MCLVPHPFCWQMSLIDALSSYVKWCYTIFPIVFSVELGCFHLFYPITQLLKIFPRNLHMLLRIDYISACVIHFKFTLLLEDIFSWHVGGRFFMVHSVHCVSNKKFELMLTGRAKAYSSSRSQTVSLSPAIFSRLLRGYSSLMPSCAGFLEPRRSRLKPLKSTFNAENYICSLFMSISIAFGEIWHFNVSRSPKSPKNS